MSNDKSTFLDTFYKEYSPDDNKFKALNQFYIDLGTDLYNKALSSVSSSFMKEIETYKYIPAQLIKIDQVTYRYTDIVNSPEFEKYDSGPVYLSEYEKVEKFKSLPALEKSKILEKLGLFIEFDGTLMGTETIRKTRPIEVIGFEAYSTSGDEWIRNVDYFFRDNKFYILKEDRRKKKDGYVLLKDIAIDLDMPYKKIGSKLRVPYEETLTRDDYNQVSYALMRIALGGFTVGNLNKALSFVNTEDSKMFAYDRLSADDKKRKLWGDPSVIGDYLTRFDFVVAVPVGEESSPRMDMIRRFMNRLRLKHTSFVIIPYMELIDYFDLSLYEDILKFKFYIKPLDYIDGKDGGYVKEYISYKNILRVVNGMGVSDYKIPACKSHSFDGDMFYDRSFIYDSEGELGENSICFVQGEDLEFVAYDDFRFIVDMTKLVDNMTYDEVIRMLIPESYSDNLEADEFLNAVRKLLLKDGFISGDDVESYDNQALFDNLDSIYDKVVESSDCNQFAVDDPLSVLVKAKTIMDLLSASDSIKRKVFKLHSDGLEVSEILKTIGLSKHIDGFSADVKSSIYDHVTKLFDSNIYFDEISAESEDDQFTVTDDGSIDIRDTARYNKHVEGVTADTDESSDFLDDISDASEGGTAITIVDKETGEKRIIYI